MPEGSGCSQRAICLPPQGFPNLPRLMSDAFTCPQVQASASLGMEGSHLHASNVSG